MDCTLRNTVGRSRMPTSDFGDLADAPTGRTARRAAGPGGGAVSVIPEPPVGSTVEDDRGHRWRRSERGWVGCITCDPRETTTWSWELVVDDCRDSGGPHLVKAP